MKNKKQIAKQDMNIMKLMEEFGTRMNVGMLLRPCAGMMA